MHKVFFIRRNSSINCRSLFLPLMCVDFLMHRLPSWCNICENIPKKIYNLHKNWEIPIVTCKNLFFKLCKRNNALNCLYQYLQLEFWNSFSSHKYNLISHPIRNIFLSFSMIQSTKFNNLNLESDAVNYQIHNSRHYKLNSYQLSMVASKFIENTISVYA